MTIINLLPWREKNRSQHKLQFFTTCLLVICVVIIINGIWYGIMQGRINHQNKRNVFLQNAIQFNRSILGQKKKLDTEQSEVMSQINTLKELHDQRYRMVELLDVLPKILPSDLFVTTINVQKESIELQGYALTEIQISELVKNLNQQAGWKKIQLQEMAILPNSPDKTMFRITLSME